MGEPPASSSFAAQLWANVPQIVAVLGVIAVGYGVIAWGVGSVRPQSQIDLENLKADVVKAAARLSVAETRLDALPRASDYADWTAHLARLDAVFDAQRDKTTANAYDIKDLQNKYQSLTAAPPRK